MQARDFPVLATFTGLAAVPWLALARNSLAPRFCIGPQGIEYRVILSGRARFGEVVLVQYRSAPLTHNLVFRFKGRLLSLAANFGSAEAARLALATLPPTMPLDEQAQALLRS